MPEEMTSGWKQEAFDYVPFDTVPGDRYWNNEKHELEYSRLCCLCGQWVCFEYGETHGWSRRDGRVGRWYCGSHEPLK